MGQNINKYYSTLISAVYLYITVQQGGDFKVYFEVLPFQPSEPRGSKFVIWTLLVRLDVRS